MSGIENYNREVFRKAEKWFRDNGFRDNGYSVYNPSAYDDTSLTREQHQRRNFAELVKCTHVALLPSWRESKGAKAEVLAAIEMGFRFYRVDFLRTVHDSSAEVNGVKFIGTDPYAPAKASVRADSERTDMHIAAELCCDICKKSTTTAQYRSSPTGVAFNAANDPGWIVRPDGFAVCPVCCSQKAYESASARSHQVKGEYTDGI
jgi:hypothetical protein